MKYLILFLLLFGAGSFSYAQYSETDNKVKAKILELKNANVDKYIVYNVSCNGRIPKIVIEGKCTAYDIQYVVWLEKGRSYLQQFNECNDYKAKLIKGGFFDIISKRLHEIDTAKILYPQLKVTRNGQFVSEDVIQDHTCSSIFKIHWGSKFMDKRVDQFNLSFKYSDKHELNVNYQHNQKSILNTLFKQINRELTKAGYPSK